MLPQSIFFIICFRLQFFLSVKGDEFDIERERSYPTPLRHSKLLPQLLHSLAHDKTSPSTSCEFKGSYDYIVVGAGTAGSVVAARLSEVPCVTVMVLEAGPAPPKLNDILAIGNNFIFTDLDWQFRTAPQKFTGRGLVNGQVYMPSGRGLGGSTLINGAIHLRGNKRDYNDWAIMGARGWSYDEVMPYFMKIEDNQDPEMAKSGYHGVGGPVTVMRPPYESEILGPINKAGMAMGYNVVDANGCQQTGFADVQINLRNGTRCNAAKAYLIPAENRPNIDILVNAFVRKVIIKDSCATGVLFDYNGKTYQVNANREVILSAGGVKSPHILLLSGIGPKEQLEKFHIPVVADLPVGENLQDHGSVTVDFLLKSHIKGIVDKITDHKSIKQFIKKRTGVLTSIQGITNIAFLPYNDCPINDFPRFQLFIGEGTTTTAKKQWNLKPELYKQVYGPYEGKSLMYCYVQQLHPKSRGCMTLQSPNPYVPPLIDPNYLSDPSDIDDIIEGMKACRQIASSNHMKHVIKGPLKTLYPGCEKFAHHEDDYLHCVARTVFLTQSRYIGAVKMGAYDDPTTVLDPQLRVKNVKNLRVADVSVMPKVVTGPTSTAAMMIGEKAADMIKETIQCENYLYEHEHKYNQQGVAGSISFAQSKSSGGESSFAESKAFYESK